MSGMALTYSLWVEIVLIVLLETSIGLFRKSGRDHLGSQTQSDCSAKTVSPFVLWCLEFFLAGEIKSILCVK